MRDLSRCARVPGAIALMLWGSVAAGQVAEHGAPVHALAPARETVPVAAATRMHERAAPPTMRIGNAVPNARPTTDRAGIRTVTSPPRLATIPAAKTPQPPSVLEPLPYKAVGHIEESGVRKVVIARGDRILLKTLGDEVEVDYRLVVVDPPALLHLPTGTVVQVPRRTQTKAASNAAALRDSDPAVVGIREHVAPLDATNPAQFEEALARALAAR